MLPKWFTQQNQTQPSRIPPTGLWGSTPLGRSVLAVEQQLLQRHLSGHEQDTVVELAPLEMAPAEVSQTLSLRAAISTWQTPLLASLETLPLLSRSVDIMLWRYLGLEWRARRRLLADVARVLVPGGKLITVALNPLDARVWHLAGMSNVSLQVAGGVTTIARTLGMQLADNSWHGPGWWRFRPLQVSVLHKATLGGASPRYTPAARRGTAQPAIALSRASRTG